MTFLKRLPPFDVTASAILGCALFGYVLSWGLSGCLAALGFVWPLAADLSQVLAKNILPLGAGMTMIMGVISVGLGLTDEPLSQGRGET